MNASSISRLLEKLLRPKYREAYMAETVRTRLALQMRALREQRELSQLGMGKLIAKPQSVVSRLEDPDYGKVSVQTLLDVAAALDVGLLIQFVPFPEFVTRTRNLSPQTLQVPSFDQAAFESAFSARPTNFYLLTAAAMIWSTGGRTATASAVPASDAGASTNPN